MGKQEGTILLTGRVGNISFYKTREGYFARKTSGVSGERIRSEPAYARTRENIAEFGRASLATKLFRRAFRSLVQRAVDSRVSGRLTGAMVKVIQGDSINDRGKRNVTNGDATLLEGFQLNKKSALTSAFDAPFKPSIDRATGRMTIEIPAFAPEVMVCGPPGATHFRLRAGGAAIDFEGDTFSADTSETPDLPLTGEQAPLQLSLQVARSANPMFLVFGIEFLQMVNGRRRLLYNGEHNAMAIVRVNGSPLPDIVHRNVSALKRQLSAGKSFKDRGPHPFNRKPAKQVEQAGCASDQDRMNPSERMSSIRIRAD